MPQVPERPCLMCQAREALGDDDLFNVNQRLSATILRLRRQLEDCADYEVLTAWGGDPVADCRRLQGRVEELEEIVDRLNKRGRKAS